MKFRVTLAAAALAASLGSVAPGATAQTTEQLAVPRHPLRLLPVHRGRDEVSRRPGSSINVDADTLFDNLKFAFMGFFEARKARWGGFVDFMYLDVGGDSTQTRNLTIRGQPLPLGVTANLNSDLKGSVVTFAGEYAAVTDPALSLDILAGARLLAIKETLNWQFSADLPSGTGPSRSGNTEEKADNWDAVIGVKGRLRFGANREWFVPYYADVGTGIPMSRGRPSAASATPSSGAR